MINWLLIVIIAYFLNALASVVDKFLLTKKIPEPAVYAFFISVLSVLVVLLIPLSYFIPQIDFFVPGNGQIFVSLLAGLTFTFALLYLFKALKKNEASRITPFVGGWQPFLILILSFLFLGERLGQREIFAFFCFLAGTILITLNIQPGRSAGKKGFGLALMAAGLFAVSYVLTKNVYLHQPFINGFIWTRFGAFSGALLLLLSKTNRQAIAANFHQPSGKQKKTGLLFFGGQTAGALSFVMVNYAISLASVSLVKALEGLQYAFLLIIVWLLARFSPQILREKMTPLILGQKVVAIILIGIGFCILAIQ